MRNIDGAITTETVTTHTVKIDLSDLSQGNIDNADIVEVELFFGFGDRGPSTKRFRLTAQQIHTITNPRR